MTLKIRCPHCRRVLLAEEFTIGEEKRCPACNGVFHVPIPESAAPAAAPATVRRCARCEHEIGLTATYCRRCFTDQSTKRPLPLVQRLRLGSARAWLGVAATLVAALGILAAAAGVGLSYYRKHAQAALPRFEPTPPRTIDPRPYARRLLEARTPDERRSAAREIEELPPDTAPATIAVLADALAQSLDGKSGDARDAVGRRAAIALIVRLADRMSSGSDPAPTGDPSVVRTLIVCQRRPELRDAALHARGRLGDAGALTDLLRLWLDRQRQTMFLERLAALLGREESPGLAAYRRSAVSQAAETSAALRPLAHNSANHVLEPLGDAYWESWGWLGQSRGEVFADRLFELARPSIAPRGAQSLLTFQAEEIRGARRLLKQMAERGSPLAQAAAGLVLIQCMPQYQSLRESIVAALAKELPGCSPAIQQRLAWALARLTGRTFDQLTENGKPADATAADIQAVERWAAQTFGAGAPAATAQTISFPAPPALTLHVVSVRRQIERDLLPQLQESWSVADAAIGRWIAADLGWTPRLAALLRSGRGDAESVGLASAIVLAAVAGEESARPQLEGWRIATDRPAAIRSLAYAALGALDARAGRWNSRWPDGFSLGDAADLERGRPGWSHFGRIVAAGGSAMTERLTRGPRSALTPAERSKLIESARRYAAEHAGE
jgi:phage FluMu protein Com